MKNALITGASGGIGSAIATAFAKIGYSVAIHYNQNRTSADELAQTLARDYGTRVAVVGADVADRGAVNAMFDEIDRTLGSIDVLVNNAGIAAQRLFDEITADEWQRMIGTNLTGVFNCSQEALRRYMLKSHSGVILNISSMWGQVGASCEVHYSAAKAGVIGLTKALAKEVGPTGVRVNCICPGVVMTEMMKGFDEPTLTALKDDSPLGLLGTPQDIADSAVFLCSDKARFITGQVLGVNGGVVI